MAIRLSLLSCLIFLLSLTTFASVATSQDRCDYSVKVKTGNVNGAGTDAKISLMFISSSGTSFTVDELAREWGVPKWDLYNFFERGYVDDFKGRANCLDICAITVFSNNQGHWPGWYLEYVDITLSGPSYAGEKQFTVNKWLAVDESPYILYAHVNKCSISLSSNLTLSSM